MLYRSLVEPYLRYCNTTWVYCGATLLNRLQTLQNRAARDITGILYEDADHNRILEDLNILNVRQLVPLDSAFLCTELKMIQYQRMSKACLQRVVKLKYTPPGR